MKHSYTHTKNKGQNSYKGFNQNQGKPGGIIHCCASVCFCFDLWRKCIVQPIVLILVIFFVCLYICIIPSPHNTDFGMNVPLWKTSFDGKNFFLKYAFGIKLKTLSQTWLKYFKLDCAFNFKNSKSVAQGGTLCSKICIMITADWRVSWKVSVIFCFLLWSGTKQSCSDQNILRFSDAFLTEYVRDAHA